MTPGQQVLARLGLAEIEAGRLELRGNQFIRNGQQVVPRLRFEPEVAATVATSAPGAEVRLQSREQTKDLERATKFAPLPEARLIKSDMCADRARMARSQPQRQASAWPGRQFALLPEPVLVTRRRRKDDSDDEEG
jgi:hypothetical protein